jgi:hypothetical protein
MKDFLLLCIALLVLACSDRERSNPLDPTNPVTGGAPTGLVIQSNRDTVTIQWNAMAVDDLESYRIYRGIGNNEPILFDEVGARITKYKDTSVITDSVHQYTIQAVTAFSEGEHSQVQTIIPGLINFWVADISLYSGRLTRISYDGAHMLNYENFLTLSAVAFNPQTHTAWIADIWAERLYELRTDMSVKREIHLSSQPVDMAIDTTGERLFTLLMNENSVHQLSFDGYLHESILLPTTVSRYCRLAYDDITSSLWISNYEESLVYRYKLDNSGDSLITFTGVQDPRDIVPDPLEGGCWVATKAGITLIFDDGSISVYKDSMNIKDISLNAVNGDCYYVGKNSNTGQWATGRLSTQESVQDEIILGNDYPYLHSIQVVPGQGPRGFLVSQAYAWKLLRFDHQGQTIGTMTGFNARLDFALE